MCEVTSYLAAGQNIPQISWGCESPVLSDDNKFGLFSRTVAPITSQGPTLIAFMQQNYFKQIVILSSTDEVYFASGLELHRQLEAATIEVLKPAAFAPDNFKNATLSEIRRSGVRIVQVLAFDGDAQTVASLALREGMTSAGWSWLVVHEVLAVPAMAGWVFFRALLGSGMQTFAEQVSVYSESFFNLAVSPDSVNLAHASALHDAIMLYVHAATKVMSEGGDLRDGEAVTAAVRNTSFTGVGGTLVALDRNGDRIASFEVMNYVLEVDGVMGSVPVGLFDIAEQQYRAYERVVVWPGNTTKVPASYVPFLECGSGEKLINISLCADCPPGLYQDLRRHCFTSCKSCAPGMYSPVGGSRRCLKCKVQPGEYQPQPGQVSCLQCGSSVEGTLPDAYSTKDEGESEFESCRCSPDYFTHSSRAIECVKCLDGATCHGFNRSDGQSLAPVATMNFYGLRMMVEGQARYAFHRCKPRCCKVPHIANVNVANDSVHVVAFLELARAQNPLSECEPGYEGFMCHKCTADHYRLTSSSQCDLCPLQSGGTLWLGKILSVLMLLFVLFAWVPFIHRAKIYVPSLYILLPFFQIFGILRNLSFDWPNLVEGLGVPVSIFGVCAKHSHQHVLSGENLLGVCRLTLAYPCMRASTSYHRLRRSGPCTSVYVSPSPTIAIGARAHTLTCTRAGSMDIGFL